MMRHTNKKTSLEAFLLLSFLAATSTAFQSALTLPQSSFSRQTSNLQALIYGWDGDESVTNTEENTNMSPNLGGYFDASSDNYQCTPVGTAVAESLSYDKERAGHLARLAVAFSPPERALTLKDILQVEVICVRDDSIDIQAIICEDGGCVSLSVPIKFPNACYSHSSSHQLMEGCVLQNLHELNEEAGTLLLAQTEAQKTPEQQAEEFEEMCVLNERIGNLPHWWVPPECDESLAADCENMRALLNDAEFQADVNALAQDAIRKLPTGNHYKVLQAKVAVVGPAGICFKARAEDEYSPTRNVHILDVVYPFGGNPMQTVEELRAAVLGAVAAAEGN